MTKLVILNTYKIAILAIAATFTVACTSPSQSRSPVAEVEKEGSSDTSKMDGTTDGAGGNGTNGKVYESYIVDPQTLPAYKEILRTKISAMDKAWDEPIVKKGRNAITMFAVIWKLKKWYIAPVSLKSLNKKIIGVEFTDENTEQLALQTDSEVWIDSRLFEKMDMKDQARLLMHEYLMSLYLLKFQSLYDVCRSSQAVAANPEAYNCSNKSAVDKLMPAKPKRDLSKIDYAHIRSLTSTLLEQEQFLSQKQIVNTFQAQDFDKRIFHVFEVDNKSIEIDGAELITVLKKAAYSQQFNGACLGIQSGQSKLCDFEVKDTQLTDGGMGLEVVLKETSSQRPLRTLKISIPKLGGTLIKDETKYSMFLAEQMPQVEGAHFGSLTVLLNKEEQGPLELRGVIFGNHVLAAIRDTAKADQKCKEFYAVPVNTQAFEDDAIFVGNIGNTDPIELNGSSQTKYSTSKCH